MSDENVEGEVRGVFTKDMIDTEAFHNIELTKDQLLIEFDSIPSEDRVSRLKNLFSIMQQKLEKYFDKATIANMKIKLPTGEFNFYQAKDAIATDGWDPDSAREICEVGFTCYDLLLKQMGVAVPTSRR